MIEHIHEIIREDLIKNQKQLFNLKHYYTHKWRSNDRLLDVNVGLFRNDNLKLTAQIYVADKNTKIREQLFLDENYNIVDTDIIIKRYV
jgi:hypothetical protein